MTFAILVTSTLVLAALTALPLSRHEAWWIRALDFPRLQILVLLLVLNAAQLFLLDLSMVSSWSMLGLTFACVLYQAWWILPYTPLFPVEVKAASRASATETISVMSANVLAQNRNAAALFALVREYRPDILVTLESDEWWQTQLDTLTPDYPYAIKCPLDNLYGMHVYSRLPLQDSSIEYLVEHDVPSMHALVRLRSGKGVRMHFLHPAPPSPTENEESSERDAELVMVARSVAETDQPVIVTGDLNDVAWSETTRLFRKISGLLDPRVGRGMFNTFHADYWCVRWPLDHLFHSGHFTLRRMRRLTSIGSDHFPILAELVYEPRRDHEQAGLDDDADDRAFSERKAPFKHSGKPEVPQPGDSSARRVI